MPNPRHSRQWLPASIALTAVGALALLYVALIAVVMSYAALTVEFAQSVRTDVSAIAALEAQYLSAVAAISNADYAALGYAKPLETIFVPAVAATALR